MNYLYKICHQSGRVLFTTYNELTARNREQFGWKVIRVDKSREQFEEYMKAETNHPLWRTEYPMTKDEDQQYSDHTTNMAWFAWQASRAVIEVELPRVADSQPSAPCSAKMICAFHKHVVGECRKAILAAGIKVKE